MSKKESEFMTILPLDAEILPPSDDRVFNLKWEQFQHYKREIFA
jgi:hypothetical protein